jgi:hypothetical protein
MGIAPLAKPAKQLDSGKNIKPNELPADWVKRIMKEAKK